MIGDEVLKHYTLWTMELRTIDYETILQLQRYSLWKINLISEVTTGMWQLNISSLFLLHISTRYDDRG